MINFIRSKIKKIVYDEYNHIIIESEQYLKFEDFLIESLFQNNYLEEGFSINMIVNTIKNNINKY